MIEGLEKAIKIFDSKPSALARAIGVSQQTLQNWRARQVPARWVLKICRACHGEIKPDELRPDLYPKDEEGAAA